MIELKRALARPTIYAATSAPEKIEHDTAALALLAHRLYVAQPILAVVKNAGRWPSLPQIHGERD